MGFEPFIPEADDFETHVAKMGDHLIVCGQEFVITEVWIELNRPASLTTKQPVELMEEDNG